MYFLLIGFSLIRLFPFVDFFSSARCDKSCSNAALSGIVFFKKKADFERENTACQNSGESEFFTV